jgi:hypothetical protein
MNLIILEMNSENFDYAVFDPTQISKPIGRTKDIISIQHKNHPNRLDCFKYQGCDTIWKYFKRSVWRNANRNFLGARESITRSNFGNELD